MVSFIFMKNECKNGSNEGKLFISEVSDFAPGRGFGGRGGRGDRGGRGRGMVFFHVSFEIF